MNLPKIVKEMPAPEFKVVPDEKRGQIVELWWLGEKVGTISPDEHGPGFHYQSAHTMVVQLNQIILTGEDAIRVATLTDTMIDYYDAASQIEVRNNRRMRKAGLN